MGLLDDILDYGAEVVEIITGDKEKIRLMEQFKKNYAKYQQEIENEAKKFNEKVVIFNEIIKSLDNINQANVKMELSNLFNALKKLGEIDDSYIYENESDLIHITEESFITREKTLLDIDSSFNEIFEKKVIDNEVEIVVKQNKTNTEIISKMKKMNFQASMVLEELSLKNKELSRNIEIIENYTHCLSIVLLDIQDIIIPELYLIESFIEALKIKDLVLVEKDIKTLNVKNKIGILENTKYEKHLIFVMNALIFYSIAFKIFNVKMLDKLVEQKITEKDLIWIKEKTEFLIDQSKEVRKYRILERED